MSALQLRVRGCDEFICVDPVDWETVKDVQWNYLDGEILSNDGTSYDELVGLIGKRNMFDREFDKRRKFMIPVDMEYVYSEYYGIYVLQERKVK